MQEKWGRTVKCRVWIRKFRKNNLNTAVNFERYNSKDKLGLIYGHTVEWMKIRSEYQWYGHREKSAKFFLNLEKYLAMKSTVKMLEINDIEITNQNLINNEIHNFDEMKSHFLVRYLSLR